MQVVAVSIVLPAFNEKENLVPLIEQIEVYLSRFGIEREYIVVDDGSTDGTVESVKSAAQKHLNITLIQRKAKPSLAASIWDGICASKLDYVLVMDTDFNHSPEYIPMLLACVSPDKVALGSRYVKGGGMPYPLRYWGSYVLNKGLKWAYKLPVFDPLYGYFCCERKLLQSLDPSIFEGFGEYFLFLTVALNAKGVQFVELPSYCGKRLGGESKMQFFKYTLTLLSLILRHKEYLKRFSHV